MSTETEKLVRQLKRLEDDIERRRKDLDVKRNCLRELIIEEEINKMRNEWRLEKNTDHPVLQGHGFTTVLIFLKDRILFRLERDLGERRREIK